MAGVIDEIVARQMADMQKIKTPNPASDLKKHFSAMEVDE